MAAGLGAAAPEEVADSRPTAAAASDGPRQGPDWPPQDGAASGGGGGDGAAVPATRLAGPARLFKASLDAMMQRFYAVSPRAVSAVERLCGAAPDPFGGGPEIPYDTIAFRTFGLPGLGIRSLAGALESFGYSQQPEEWELEGGALLARWFAPPHPSLPRAFVSELRPDALSPEAREVLSRYTAGLSALPPAAVWAAAVTGALPWGSAPALDDYCTLAAESDYAAWVLTNAYAPVCGALACHRLPRCCDGSDGAAAAAVARLQAKGFALVEAAGVASRAAAGGVLRASADGLLLQAATVADLVEFRFEGEREPRLIPGPYLGLIERRPSGSTSGSGSGGSKGGLNQSAAAAHSAPHLHWLEPLRDGFDSATPADVLVSTAAAAEAAAAEAARS